MINETAQTVLDVTKAEIYSPVVISMWVSVLFLFWLVTWISSWDRKIKWENFYAVWFWTALGSGFVVTIFVMSPTVISEIINWIKELIQMLF